MAAAADSDEASAGDRPAAQGIERVLPFAIWGLVLLALALRLPGAQENWANPDEGFYLRFASVPSWGEFLRMTLLTPHPPLFFTLQRLLASFSPDVVSLRMISVVAGALGVHAVWMLGREVMNRSTGLLAALLLCFAPGAIVLSEVARPYTFVFALVTYSLTALLIHLRSGSAVALRVHALTMAAALLTHYAALPVAVACGSVSIGQGLLQRVERSQLRARVLVELALGALALALLIFHLRPYVLGTSMQQSAQVSWLTPFFVRSPGEAWLGLIGLQRYLFGREFEALAMLSLVAGFALLVWRRRYVFPVLMGVSFVFWIALSAMGQVPLGSTRHSFMGNALLLPLIALPYGWALGRGLGGAVAAAAVAGAALSFPAIPRALTGADALHTRPSVEFVARAADLEEQVEFLKALRAEAHWILMDRQTWNMLSPLWVEAGVFPERRQDYFRYAYDWGRARIGVTEGWILRVRPDEPRQLQHLAVAIRQYGRVVPRWQEADRKAWLFLGGWGADSAVVLRAADHRLSPEGPPIFDAILETPALLRARVDFRQYLERLEPSQAAE